MITSSVLGVQPPLDMLHLNVLVLPIVSVVSVVVKLLMAVIVAVPVITLHVPVPVVGRLPDNCVVGVLQIA